MQHPTARIRQRFDDKDGEIAGGLSAIEQIGDALFVASDETFSIERLRAPTPGRYDEHTSYDLAELLKPLKTLAKPTAKKNQKLEADLEGLCGDDGWLWLAGSHARKRGKPKPKHAGGQVLDKLGETDRPPARLLLARVPLAETSGGSQKLAAKADGRRAACLPIGEDDNALTRLVAKDELLKPFLKIPAKENGFDIEGLAARGDTVLLGLRGPVLNGWALVLRLELTQTDTSLSLADPSAPLFKHLLELDGLGVRDLATVGEDVLVLAGPSMQLDGPTVLYRWRKAFAPADPGPVALERLFQVPNGDGCDHAEGICLFRRPPLPPQLLVVYDSPPTSRLYDGGFYEAELFDLPA